MTAARGGTTVTIQPVDAALLEQVLPLIADYQRFYEQVPDPSRNERFFSQLLAAPATGVQFAASEAGRVVGFATLYFLPSSLSATPYCLLNDLYTVPELRGRGVARQLIAHCHAWAVALGFDGLEWVTHSSNQVAQRLYDSLPAAKSAWYCYALPKDASS